MLPQYADSTKAQFSELTVLRLSTRLTRHDLPFILQSEGVSKQVLDDFGEMSRWDHLGEQAQAPVSVHLTGREETHRKVSWNFMYLLSVWMRQGPGNMTHCAVLGESFGSIPSRTGEYDLRLTLFSDSAQSKSSVLGVFLALPSDPER